MNMYLFKTFLVFLMIEIFFIFLILIPPISKDARLSLDVQKNIIHFFSIIMFIVIIYGFYPIMKDTFYYLSKGDKYIKQIKCVIKKTTTTPIFFFVKKNIYCKNGEEFKVFLTFNNYFKNEIFKFKYLPNSKLLISEEIIYSPYKKRLKRKTQ